MQTSVSIPGMHCASCAAMIKDVSSEFSAISKVDVDLEKKTVTVEHGDGFDISRWKQEIETLGESYNIFPFPSP